MVVQSHTHTRSLPMVRVCNIDMCFYRINNQNPLSLHETGSDKLRSFNGKCSELSTSSKLDYPTKMRWPWPPDRVSDRVFIVL